MLIFIITDGLSPPEKQQEKQKDFNKLWHDDEWMEKNIQKADEFDYSQFDSLSCFQDTHPKVMHERIEKLNYSVNLNITRKRFKNLLQRFFYFLEKATGYRVGEYKNYRKI